MKSFNFNFQWEKDIFKVDPSYLKEIERQLTPYLNKNFIKAGYEGGNFQVFVTQTALPKPGLFKSPGEEVEVLKNINFIHSDKLNWEAFSHVSIPLPSHLYVYMEIYYSYNSCGIKNKKDFNRYLGKKIFYLDPNNKVNKDNFKIFVRKCHIPPPLHIYKSQMEKAAQKEAEKFEKFLKDNCNFEVELAFEDYPDIIFEIYFDVDITDELTEKTLEVMSKFIDSWNRKRERQGLEGYIHYIDDARSTIENPAKNAAYIHVDMGDANLTALKHLLKSLNKPYLPIKNIVIS